MNQIVRIKPVVDIHSILADGELVAFSVGPDGQVYLVTALSPLDYTLEQPGWAIFPKTVPDQPQSYRVIALSEQQTTLDVVIQQEEFNIHHIQPLGDNLLLVCARCHYKEPEDYEENGRIYTRTGEFISSILLGDGIETVQTTSNKVIWTSYFDEGIFGNFGWEAPLGSPGLIAWDSAGNRLYEFQPTEGLDSMCDCYALNVETEDDVWCYYYTQFPLVHIEHGKIKAFWEMPIGGSDAFAVAKGHALFRGGYQERDIYHLFSLESDGQARRKAKIEFQDSEGSEPKAEHVVGRADAIHFVRDGCIYRIRIEDVTES